MSPGTRLLFPKPDGTRKVPRVFADCICRVMERELGIKFNIHLFRHIGCFLYLRSHPGQLDAPCRWPQGCHHDHAFLRR